MKRIECDVLVIGGGVAGTCAAAEASQNNAKTIMAVKGIYKSIGIRGAGASACGRTEWGGTSIMFQADPKFDHEALKDKIIKAGLGLADRKLVDLFMKRYKAHSVHAKHYEQLSRSKGGFALGAPFVHNFAPEPVPFDVLDNTMVIDIVIEDNKVKGVYAVNELSNRKIFIACSSVVIATGGAAGVYSINAHPDCVTGDGYAMGLRAGAELMNIEFMQMFNMIIHPNINLFHMWHPSMYSNITNGNGHRFLKDYLPEGITEYDCIKQNVNHTPFSVRDDASRYLAIGMTKEIINGNASPNGGVWVDAREGMAHHPVQEAFLKYRGIDFREAPVEVAPGFQCSNGGIKVDEKLMTKVEGLFAAGEATAGFHGADRLGGHMISLCILSGELAGRNAARLSTDREENRYIPEVVDETTVSINENPSWERKLKHARKIIQKRAWETLLIIKSEKGIKNYLKELESIKEEVLVIPDRYKFTVEYNEMRNIITCGEAIARACLNRKESRGGFYREDYPEQIMGKVFANIVSLEEDKVVVNEMNIDEKWDDSSSELVGHWG